MLLRDMPQVEAALKDVWPVYPVLWEGFDTAITLARTMIDDTHETLGVSSDEAARPGAGGVYDPYLLPHLVRYAQKLYLAGRGLPTEIEVDDLAFSGLCLRYGQRVIRLRKAGPQDSIPSAGASAPWRAVYQLILSEEFAYTQPDLVMLWHASRSGMFTGMSLVCAVPGRHGQEKILGRIVLPNPAEAGMFQGPPLMKESDLDVLDDVLGDLPIEALTAAEASELLDGTNETLETMREQGE